MLFLADGPSASADPPAIHNPMRQILKHLSRLRHETLRPFHPPSLYPELEPLPADGPNPEVPRQLLRPVPLLPELPGRLLLPSGELPSLLPRAHLEVRGLPGGTTVLLRREASEDRLWLLWRRRAR